MSRSDRTAPDAPAGARTHYQVLGVRPTASRDELRTAHRQLAHLLHPDRLAGASSAERTLAERRMREVNAAWSVLSDPDRRAAYDRSLLADGTSSPTRGRTTAHAAARSSLPEDADDPDAAFARARAAELDPDEPELSAAHFWLLRRGPLVAALVVAFLLFVVTAYAGSGGGAGGGAAAGPTTTQGALADGDGDCVLLDANGTPMRVGCEGRHDGRIARTVRTREECPADTRYMSLTPAYVCVLMEDDS